MSAGGWPARQRRRSPSGEVLPPGRPGIAAEGQGPRAVHMLKSELAPEKHPLHSIRRFVVGANRFPHREHGRAVAPSNGFSPPPRAAPGIGPRKIAFFNRGRSLGWTILGINAA